MATEYLSSTTTFGGTVWSGAALATAGDYVINIQGLNITGGLDATGVTSGIDSLDIESTATGRIGGAAAGSFEVEANTGVARVTNRGAVTLYLAAKGLVGATDHITNFAASNGENYLTGGGFTNVAISRGARCDINASTVVTNFYATGGSGTIAPNATALTLAYITGGSWVIERTVTTLILGPGASVTYNGNKDGNGYAITTANLYGRARLNLLSGNVPTLNKFGGIIDTTRTERALTIGGTAFNNYTGIPQEASSLATISNETFPGALSKVVEPIPGAPGEG